MYFLEKKRQIYEGLTRANYFPNQKGDETEIPPNINTRQFTPELVELIVKLKESKERQKLGYDHVDYSVTRHNNIPRKLALIHPVAYSHLSKTIADNWEEIEKKVASTHSMIRPEEHQDGRLVIMNYEGVVEKSRRVSKESFGKRFRVNADITSCFHSIYSHSIPWAIRGFQNCKNALIKPSKHWSDDLDRCIRKSKRNETLGIAIGPATSNVIVELVLCEIDDVLIKNGFIFKRYIDDYICHCETHEESQEFIRTLGRELEKFKLTLNLRKTNIISLPEPITDDWICELTARMPAAYISEDYTCRKYLSQEVISYLDAATKINKTTPDGSVLKFAIKSVINNLDDTAVCGVLDYIINLAWHFPLIIPLLDTLFLHAEVDPLDYENRLNLLIIENSKSNRSDGMAWPIFYLKKYDLTISQDAFDAAYGTKDCITLLNLYFLNACQAKVVGYVQSLNGSTFYERDNYWLLLYQIYRDGYSVPLLDEQPVFDLMKKYEVNFCPSKDDYSVGEIYCSYYNNPFIDDDVRQMDFLSWLQSEYGDKYK